MKTPGLIIIFLGCAFISASFSTATAQILVPGMHGISTVPEVKFTWVIISSDHDISLNIRYSGNGTTPPVTLTATAFANPKATDGFLNQTSMLTTIGTSQILNGGWSSPSSIVLTFNEIPSLLDADLVTVVASPYASIPQSASPITAIPQSGCDPSYPEFCIPPPHPLLNCDTQQKNFTVLPPDPHGFDRDKDGRGCEADE
jgi:hypothetical protein